MTSIDTSQALVGLLRARIAMARRASALRPASRSSDAVRSAATSVAQRIQALSAEDPDRRRKAVRVYLESELAREFGSTVLNDPAFPRMLDDVQAQMAQDPATARAVHALGELLLSEGRR